MIVETFDGDPGEDRVEIPDSTVLEMIKGTYKRTVYAEYIAATLTYVREIDGRERILCFTVDEENINEIQYYLALLYVENKTKNHSYWDPAQRVIGEWELRKGNGDEGIEV